MKKIVILIIVFALVLPAAAYAKHCGPLWAVWTHSEKSHECAIKTAFWMTLAIASVCYIANRVTTDDSTELVEIYRPRTALGLPLAGGGGEWELEIWPYPDEKGTPVIGLTISW